VGGEEKVATRLTAKGEDHSHEGGAGLKDGRLRQGSHKGNLAKRELH